MTKILIIDDSELVSRMLKEAFTELGFEVAQAMDANQGYMVAIDVHPDLIILDIQLPDVTGFELCRVLKNRQELRDVPIIMVTGSHHKIEDKVRGFQLGADDYVQKPFEMAELVERVRAVLRRKTPAAALPAALPVLPPSVIVQPPPVPSQPIDLVISPQPAQQVSVVTPNVSSAVMPVEMLPSAEPVSRAPESQVQGLPLASAVSTILLNPLTFPEGLHYASVGKPYVLLLVGVGVAGLMFSAGMSTKPIVAGLTMASVWTLLLSVLVVSSSILGIHLRWRDGAALLSLAGLPVLIKLISGLVFAIITSLSPFYFTASPALLTGTGSMVLRRVDVFEIWSAALLFILIRRVPNGNPKKAGWITALVWAVAAALAIAFEKWSVEV